MQQSNQKRYIQITGEKTSKERKHHSLIIDNIPSEHFEPFLESPSAETSFFVDSSDLLHFCRSQCEVKHIEILCNVGRVCRPGNRNKSFLQHKASNNLRCSFLMSSTNLGNNRINVKRQLTTTSLGVFLPYKIKELMQFGDSLCMGQNKITGHIIMADVKTLANPNTLVLGTPGRGKSFSVKMMMIQTYMKLKDDILICDPEGEYGPLVNKLKGQIVHLSQSSSEHINPLHIDPDCDWSSDPIGNKCQLIMSIYEQILGPGKIGAYERSILDRCTQKLYKKFSVTKNVEDLPILEDLFNELAEQEEKEARYLRTSLEVYVHGSLNYFNHPTNVDMHNRVICFDIKELGEQLKNLAMLVVQETVWGRVTVNRNAGRYTRYFVDEFHLLLKEPRPRPIQRRSGSDSVNGAVFP